MINWFHLCWCSVVLTLSVIVVFIHLSFGLVLVVLDIHYNYISSLLDVWFSCNLILFILVYLSYCNQLTAIHVNKVSYFLFGVHFLFLFVLAMIVSLLFIDHLKNDFLAYLISTFFFFFLNANLLHALGMARKLNFSFCFFVIHFKM